MVTVVEVAERQSKEGKPFMALIVQGGVEFVQSQKSGRFYATARKASIATTFTREFCEQLIGTQIPGSIQRMEVEAYEFAIPETGEVVQLTHTYLFVPEGQEANNLVPEGAMVH